MHRYLWRQQNTSSKQYCKLSVEVLVLCQANLIISLQTLHIQESLLKSSHDRRILIIFLTNLSLSSHVFTRADYVTKFSDRRK